MTPESWEALADEVSPTTDSSAAAPSNDSTATYSGLPPPSSSAQYPQQPPPNATSPTPPTPGNIPESPPAPVASPSPAASLPTLSHPAHPTTHSQLETPQPPSTAPAQANTANSTTLLSPYSTTAPSSTSNAPTVILQPPSVTAPAPGVPAQAGQHTNADSGTQVSPTQPSDITLSPTTDPGRDSIAQSPSCVDPVGNDVLPAAGRSVPLPKKPTSGFSAFEAAMRPGIEMKEPQLCVPSCIRKLCFLVSLVEVRPQNRKGLN